MSCQRGRLYIVAATAGKIIGYADVSIIDEGHITNLAVHPEQENGTRGMMLPK